MQGTSLGVPNLNFTIPTSQRCTGTLRSTPFLAERLYVGLPPGDRMSCTGWGEDCDHALAILTRAREQEIVERSPKQTLSGGRRFQSRSSQSKPTKHNQHHSRHILGDNVPKSLQKALALQMAAGCSSQSCWQGRRHTPVTERVPVTRCRLNEEEPASTISQTRLHR